MTERMLLFVSGVGSVLTLLPNMSRRQGPVSAPIEEGLATDGDRIRGDFIAVGNDMYDAMLREASEAGIEVRDPRDEQMNLPGIP
jgi:hypothetical protein